jgi:hypothetical protein
VCFEPRAARRRKAIGPKVEIVGLSRRRRTARAARRAGRYGGGDETRATSAGEEADLPTDDDEQAILEPDQIPEVRDKPDEVPLRRRKPSSTTAARRPIVARCIVLVVKAGRPASTEAISDEPSGTIRRRPLGFNDACAVGKGGLRQQSGVDLLIATSRFSAKTRACRLRRRIARQENPVNRGVIMRASGETSRVMRAVCAFAKSGKRSVPGAQQVSAGNGSPRVWTASSSLR